MFTFIHLKDLAGKFLIYIFGNVPMKKENLFFSLTYGDGLSQFFGLDLFLKS